MKGLDEARLNTCSFTQLGSGSKICFTAYGLLVRRRGGSRGRVQGVRTPPPPHPEMTCGFLIQLAFCEKKKKELCGLLVLK